MHGGARANSGPAPDPLALRRNRPSDQATWTHLPAREGAAPPWPLTRQTAREKTLWAREWARPQALMWEKNGWEAEVALYVRTLAFAEHTKAPMVSRTLVRQFMEGLGISGDGLRRNRWIIDAEQAPAQEIAEAPASDKERFLRVVKDAS
jgi:hypothetical protein